MLLLFPKCSGRQLLQPTRCRLEATSLFREYPLSPRGLFGGLFLKAQARLISFTPSGKL
jgi:hypothetical protein